jgi:hypothetical protein
MTASNDLLLPDASIRSPCPSLKKRREFDLPEVSLSFVVDIK